LPPTTVAPGLFQCSSDQGRTAADFAASTRVLASGWKTLTDCGGGCATNATLLDNGRVSVRGGCEGSGGGAFVFVYAAADANAPSFFEGFSGMQGTNIHFLAAPQSSATTTVHEANFDLVAPTGPALAGTVTAIANTPSAGHCAFDASAING
jgi:hypothetical protein